ncbi:uncharacterized protein C1orf146 homolog [Geospiza fortis]|uniref:Uncharacterized protein C1orf146 homolog n=1 Tax=Geospiza fortis TaxID=48883 RepID=A0A6I9HJQ4_GEOFO|nr:uncharacterized protein C1orf146 homolog [Geospiza fortis]
MTESCGQEQTRWITTVIMSTALQLYNRKQQQRFLGSNLRVIPVHNPAETVKLMLTMAKVTSKPQADDTRCKIEMTKAQIIEKSPVWKMLQEYQSHRN